MAQTIIDSKVWVTAKDLIDELNKAGKPTSPQQITNWKRRGKIEYKHFPELGKDLIKRGSIMIAGYEGF